ncbi:MAG TPA: hypothetical protein VK390_17470 [Propionibacteriaceae bacterium]|nr:hypothetical protein [Propionibacteriaceae bacterium]
MIRIALGRERFEHPRFVAMRSHYGYDSFFCAPGVEGAHEKGGVEGEIGRFRRRHLTPIPHVGSLETLNAALAAADALDDARHISGRAETRLFVLEVGHVDSLTPDCRDPPQVRRARNHRRGGRPGNAVADAAAPRAVRCVVAVAMPG